jgi:hypothetical protein
MMAQTGRRRSTRSSGLPSRGFAEETRASMYSRSSVLIQRDERGVSAASTLRRASRPRRHRAERTHHQSTSQTSPSPPNLRVHVSWQRGFGGAEGGGRRRRSGTHIEDSRPAQAVNDVGTDQLAGERADIAGGAAVSSARSTRRAESVRAGPNHAERHAAFAGRNLRAAELERSRRRCEACPHGNQVLDGREADALEEPGRYACHYQYWKMARHQGRHETVGGR